jgi:predicted Zn-dependent protease with MMP-like domain
VKTSRKWSNKRPTRSRKNFALAFATSLFWWRTCRRNLLGLFHGVPTTRKSTFDLPTGPDYIVLYQKNIEAICSSEAEVREQIRLTVIHELGHYFGMDEDQLKDV